MSTVKDFYVKGNLQVLGTTNIDTTTVSNLQINDTSKDHQYIFNVSELSANRNITLPLLTTDDTFVFVNHLQTLTKKIIVPDITAHGDTSPTLTILSSMINTFTPSVAKVVTLPSISVATNYTYKFIMLSGAGSIIITAPDGDIEGSSTFTLSILGQTTSLTSDGAVWRIYL